MRSFHYWVSHMFNQFSHLKTSYSINALLAFIPCNCSKKRHANLGKSHAYRMIRSCADVQKHSNRAFHVAVFERGRTHEFKGHCFEWGHDTCSMIRRLLLTGFPCDNPVCVENLLHMHALMNLGFNLCFFSFSFGVVSRYQLFVYGRLCGSWLLFSGNSNCK